jgi:hypothetical protein
MTREKEKEREKELCKCVLTYLFVYKTGKTYENMVSDLIIVTRNSRELNFVKAALRFELSCRDKFSEIDGIIVRSEDALPDCCAACDSVRVKYNEYSDGDWFEMMSANLYCKEASRPIGENIFTDDMYVREIEPWCPKLKQRKN